MFWLSIVRIAVLAWILLCSLVLLGVGAQTLSAVGSLDLPSFAWAGLAVATAVLTLLTVPAMLAIDLLRRGAFTSMIVVELSWFGFLGVLYLATGGAAAENAADFWVQCDVWNPASARTLCTETSAAAAFGFLGWLPLWGYTGVVLVLLIIQAQRGNYIWKSSVKEANFQGGGSGGIAPGVYGDKPYDPSTAVQMPYSYPPANSPPQSTGPHSLYPQA